MENTFQCLNCQTVLEIPRGNPKVNCLNCNKSYPMLHNTIPVLLNAPRQYLVQNFLSYSHLEKEQQQLIYNMCLLHESPNTTVRLDAEQLIEAVQHNKSILSKIKSSISPHLELNDLVDFHFDQSISPYLFNFNYLRRDWCGLADHEVELEGINERLNHALEFLETDGKNALVLGAGTGRIAYDLSQQMSNVIAIDNALTMAYFYQQLQEQAITFYDINLRNQITNAEQIVRRTAQIDEDLKTNQEGLSYVLGDVRSLPLPDNSVDLIVSVYFSDVLPFGEMVEELKRVLKPGGVFFHFGPLQYHFDDLSQMMSLETWQAVLQDHQFYIQHQEFKPTWHYETGRSLVSRQYNNWVGIATYQPLQPEPIPELTLQSVMTINDPLTYQVNGSLSSNAVEESAFVLNLSAGRSFTVPEIIVDLIRLLDGQRTLQEVFLQLQETYGTIGAEDRSQILSILTAIQKAGAVQHRCLEV